MNPLPEHPALSVDVRVHYYDTDAGGVVHNIAYLRLIEEARTRLAEHLDWSLEAMAAGPVVPVVARTEIDYLKPARLGDRLRIEARLAALGASSFDIEFEMTRPADATLIARCRQRLVGVNLATGRPVRTRADWRERWPDLLRE